jgi:hypothetical protein
MSPLDRLHPEAKVAKLFKDKTGYGSVRQLRQWRQRRIGPDFVKIGKLIFYTDEAIAAFIDRMTHHPVRSRRAA